MTVPIEDPCVVMVIQHFLKVVSVDDDCSVGWFMISKLDYEVS